MIPRLLLHLFKVPVETTDPFIQDKLGRKILYGYEGEKPFYIDFAFGEIPVGLIQLSWTQDEVEIADIILFDPKFRRQGLGTEMFALIKSLASANNISKISGIISPTDRENVDLEAVTDFYIKQGCSIHGRRFEFNMNQQTTSDHLQGAI